MIVTRCDNNVKRYYHDEWWRSDVACSQRPNAFAHQRRTARLAGYANAWRVSWKHLLGRPRDDLTNLFARCAQGQKRFHQQID